MRKSFLVSISIISFIFFIVWYNTAAGGTTFGPQQEIINIPSGDENFVYAADLDGDGDMDVLSVSVLASMIAWYENLGEAIFGPQQVITNLLQGAQSIYIADLDGDTDLDVLSASLWDGKIAWYENLGGGVFGPQQVITASEYQAYSVYAGDLDGDGDLDVLAGFSTKITWYENTGGATFSIEHVINASANYAYSVLAADLDNDSYLDVLSVSSEDNKVAWYKNIGEGVFSSQQVITTSVEVPVSIYATDLDGDNDLDVLSASLIDDKIAWYENMGGGSFGPQMIISVSAIWAYSVYAADLDNDGDMDVLSASRDDNKIAWYENTGGGSFGPQMIISVSAIWPTSVYAADLDNDGDQDVLSASMNKIGWHENLLTKINVTYPSAPNIVWEMLTNEAIQWNSVGNVGSNVKIDLYKNWKYLYTIDTEAPNTGSYPWFVSRHVEPGNYQIKVISKNKPAVGDYSHTFSIIASSTVPDPKQYVALQIDTAFVPEIDGVLDDPVWSGIDADSLVYGGVVGNYMTVWNQFQDNLVTWQAVWCEETNKLYVGIEVKDDIRGTFDNEPGSPNYNPAHDESLEFMTDGDYSGGEYWQEFGPTQYWRVTEENHRDLYNYPSVADYPQEYTGDAFVTAVQQGANGNWTCEAVFTIYDTYPQTLRNLQEGDFIGWDIWYDDSDDENNNGSYFGIDHQTGWNYQGPCWRYADYSGDLILGGLAGLQSLYVIYPNDSGIVLQTEQTVPIEWRSYGDIGEKVKLDLYKTGQYHSTITDTTDNDGYYDWQIPEDHETGSGFQVKITSINDTSQYDFSNHSFTIQKKPRLTITSPDTEKVVWKIGKSYDITWNREGETGEHVRLGLERKNVYYAYAITDSTENDGLYSWLIPADVDTGTDYRVMISSLSDPELFDYSDSTFTIELAPALTVTCPDTEKVEWKTGESYTITWTSAGDVGDDVKLELYQEEMLKRSIMDSTENDGEYEWSVPADLDTSSDYRIKITSLSDTTIYDFSDSSFTIKTETGVEAEPLIPLTTQLHPNYPNPFNPETTIKYEISKTCDVRIRIYNLLGKEVRNLVNEKKSPGAYKMKWDGRNNHGIKVSSGIFILEMQAGEFTQRRKMSLLR